MHIEPLNIDITKAVDLGPLGFVNSLRSKCWALICLGLLTIFFGLAMADPAEFWAAYYTNLVFFMGLSFGGVMITVILQIVKASWSPPVRRIAEANIAFIPYALGGWLFTYLGREQLFFWGHSPMPGREWWMQPNFVYIRFTLLFGLLFWFLHRFVRMALRGDIGVARERGTNKNLWIGGIYDSLTQGWKGEHHEVPAIDYTRSYRAPVIVMLYAVIYSLFAFEMIMGMDPKFYANMFGGFVFIGNIYAGWAALSLAVIFLRRQNPEYAKMARQQQMHDLGKLTFGFGILWAYLFLCHFLPIWYGNLPEETQWLILRTREEPWKTLAWCVLSACFIIPFICMLSRDVKKTPWAFGTICTIILAGLWSERYVLIMPQISPHHIPFGILEIGIFLGFLGGYIICLDNFLKKFPIVPVADPRMREEAH